MAEPVRTLWETEESLASIEIRTDYLVLHGLVTSPTELAWPVSTKWLFRQNYKEKNTSAITVKCNSVLWLIPPTCRWHCILKILRIILCLFYIYFKMTPKLFMLCLVKISRFSLSISPYLIPLSFVTVSSSVHFRYPINPPPPSHLFHQSPRALS